MNQVSRSFALVVRSIEEPLNYYLSTAYLICRVADNIEDCSQSYSWKTSRFNEFKILLNRPSYAQDIMATWTTERWPNLTSNEEKMMKLPEGKTLWEIYQKIPHEMRQSVCRWASVMTIGMNKISDPNDA